MLPKFRIKGWTQSCPGRG